MVQCSPTKLSFYGDTAGIKSYPGVARNHSNDMKLSLGAWNKRVVPREVFLRGPLSEKLVRAIDWAACIIEPSKLRD